MTDTSTSEKNLEACLVLTFGSKSPSRNAVYNLLFERRASWSSCWLHTLSSHRPTSQPKMEPWQSWGIVAVVGAGAYIYYSQSDKAKRGRARGSLIPDQAQRRNSKLRDESKGRRKRSDDRGASDQVNSDVADVSSASNRHNKKDRVKKRKGDKKQPSQLAESSAIEINSEEKVENDDAGDDGIDNKEFARLLSGAKLGTSLSKAVDSNEPKKSRKQGKRIELQPESANGTLGLPIGQPFDKGLSTSSSTTGADADDDLSPAASPAFGATQTPKAAGDVSDMLDASSKGPMILRVTEPAQPQIERQPKPKKTVKEPETKKQRQNRKRKEEEKAAREHAEKERRILLEKQLRSSREAEGRPAKNGLGISKAPVSNAWTKPGDNTTFPTSSTTPAANNTLLDTFDETREPAGSVNEGQNTYTEDKAWEHDLPSESEQLRILNELDGNDGWNTVEKSGKAKRKPINQSEKAGESEDKNYSSLAEENKPAAGQIDPYRSSGPDIPPAMSSFPPLGKPKPVKTKVDPAVWNRSNIHNHPDYDPEYPYALTGHPDDSDWAVV